MSRYQPELTPELLLNAYANGIFPMASGRHGGLIRWYAPDPRAVIEFRHFQPGRHLRRLMRTHPFHIRINRAFRETMNACASPRDADAETWISPELVDAYCDLHRLGFAHSVEAWRKDRLVGGLYLVQVGAAVMGESMFSRERDASKVCLMTLIGRLQERGFRLLDTQFLTDHLVRFGGMEIPREEYEERLGQALTVDPAPVFTGDPMELPPPGDRVTRL